MPAKAANSSVPFPQNPANNIKDVMWKFLMDHGQKPNIPELKQNVYDLIEMTTQKTAGQRGKGIPWSEFDMTLWSIVIEATALVLSGVLDELPQNSRRDSSENE